VGEHQGGSFATLTHARVRAAQGDVGGAVRILKVILSVQPGHDEARELLAQLEHSVEAPHHEPEPKAPEPVRPAEASDLKQRFRDALHDRKASPAIERMSRWLARAETNRGARHDR
jgi:hypothetical protein